MCFDTQLVGALIFLWDFFVASPLHFSYSTSSNFIMQERIIFFPKHAPDSIKQSAQLNGLAAAFPCACESEFVAWKQPAFPRFVLP